MIELESDISRSTPATRFSFNTDSTTTPGVTCPAVAAINFSAKSGGYTPNMPRDQFDLFYKAKRTMSTLLHDEEYTIKVQRHPGALVIFDNRPVLHSRSDIKDTDGKRWLQGYYFNRDGFHIKYEQMRRKWSKNLTETPFANLREASKADFDRIEVEYDKAVAQQTLDNLIEIMLKGQKPSFLGAPVSLYEHNLQTATRAFRAGKNDETVMVSLFHDLFENLAVKNHGELASAMLAPWIPPKSQWLLAHHEIFQGYYYFEYYGLDKNQRDMFVDHPYYNWTATLCELYDQASFDPRLSIVAAFQTFAYCKTSTNQVSILVESFSSQGRSSIRQRRTNECHCGADDRRECNECRW